MTLVLQEKPPTSWVVIWAIALLQRSTLKEAICLAAAFARSRRIPTLWLVFPLLRFTPLTNPI
ncbi:MAG TPA: hypothetical protein V6D14_20275 [Coleofasciculaceae cyanobacterium]